MSEKLTVYTQIIDCNRCGATEEFWSAIGEALTAAMCERGWITLRIRRGDKGVQADMGRWLCPVCARDFDRWYEGRE